jgi:hypothetical protein
MRKSARFVLSAFLIATFFLNALPCGPGYISPVFEYRNRPDNPFSDFAAGKLGIIKPTYHRVVLFAAYRYLNGQSLSPAEQKALVEVWEADFNRKDFEDKNEVNEAVKKWIAKRKEVFGQEEKTPEIYVERSYGGYDFFPNCTKNAFETATKTLTDRIISYGSNDKNVKEWVKGQDKVFENCASGKSIPNHPSPAMPDWLQKDRAYQIAAAEFYALDYDSAKRRFAEIAQDFKSPWQETAEYLVGRTLIRQASLTKDKSKAETFYIEAEQALQNVALKRGKFAEDAEKLLGLIKYRLRPKERVRELAQKLTYEGNQNFRQDLIDYIWLLDKFEKEVLEAEEKRKEEEKYQRAIAKYGNIDNAPYNIRIPSSENTNTNVESQTDDGLIEFFVYTEDFSQNSRIKIPADATDEDAFAEAEKVFGRPLTEKEKEQVRFARRSAYQVRFSDNRQSGYEGGYYGEEKLSPSVLPNYLRDDKLTEWLFIYQIQSVEAYLYALTRYRQTNAEIWLMTALSKADKNSAELNRLLDAAKKTSPTSLIYPTVAFHSARILIEQGKFTEARKFIDDILNSPLEMPVSARNQFLKQRLKLAETLEDFLKFAQRKPFAFDWTGQIGTIDEIIAEQKSWYSPEGYPNQTREEYEKETEERFADFRLLEKGLMLDYDSITVIETYFSLEVLMKALKSEILPEYYRKRLAIAIWTRAVLLGNETFAKAVVPELLKYMPELAEDFKPYQKAVTPIGRERAALYIILKNPILTPYFESGYGADNQFNSLGADNWWCNWIENNDEQTQSQNYSPPSFLTRADLTAVRLEREKLNKIGDAPQYLAEKVLQWVRLAPDDKRVPESLFRAYEANGWTKYGCGNREDLQKKIANQLKQKYPQSEWTKKLLELENPDKSADK